MANDYYKPVSDFGQQAQAATNQSYKDDEEEMAKIGTQDLGLGSQEENAVPTETTPLPQEDRADEKTPAPAVTSELATNTPLGEPIAQPAQAPTETVETQPVSAPVEESPLSEPAPVAAAPLEDVAAETVKPAEIPVDMPSTNETTIPIKEPAESASTQATPSSGLIDDHAILQAVLASGEQVTQSTVASQIFNARQANGTKVPEIEAISDETERQSGYQNWDWDQAGSIMEKFKSNTI